MPVHILKLKSGGEVELSTPLASGAQPSFFVVSLPKAGSTLLNRLVRPIGSAAGLSFFSLANTLNQLGVPPEDVDFGASQPIFEPAGYCYGGFRGLPSGMELPSFAEGRTILLVRDPRDMLTSLYFSDAFSHRPPPGDATEGPLVRAFEQRRQEALASEIDEYVLRAAPWLLKSFQMLEHKTAGLRPKLYRYEDVIFEKADWMRDVASFLNLEVTEAVVADIVRRQDVRPSSEDPSQHIRRVTPGDYREKLEVRTILRLNEILAPVLRRYGFGPAG
jgi:hypothetical protein